MKRLYHYLLFLLMIFSLVSCKKMQENYIMNGKWDVLEVTLNGGSLNQMEQFLPEYGSREGCCEYYMNYYEDGTCRAVYYIDGQVDYTTEGTWNMPEKNRLYFKVDEYVDGLFDLEKEGDGVWILHSNENTISAYNIGLVEMQMKTRRTKD